MNPLTGYLPIALSQYKIKELEDLLSRHYEVSYYEVDELTIENNIPPGNIVTVTCNGTPAIAYYSPVLELWEFSLEIDPFDYDQPLMKLGNKIA